MIPKIIHYCWFGYGEMPELVTRCIASWHTYMPDWEYRCWNESNFDISTAPAYVREAYAARKYAFVSDYVRLWALEREGGVYLDVDFEVYKSFEDLLDNHFFAGYEGSKRQPIMMGVIGSKPHGQWVSEMLHTYDNRHFLLNNNQSRRYDLYPNTQYFTDLLEQKGFVCDGIEKDFQGMMHIYPVDYFCPGLTTGENIRSKRTYCEHKGLHSWTNDRGWKQKVLAMCPPQMKITIIKLKRKLLG